MLWTDEVPRFNSAPPEQRIANLGLIRALGVVAAESGSAEEKAAVRAWLTSLLQDPEERIRRYAMNALPKVGSGGEEEKALLDLMRKSGVEREGGFIAKALDKIGGEATLNALEHGGPALPPRTVQKAKASVARQQGISQARMDQPIAENDARPLVLRSRRGLETWVVQELQNAARTRRSFKVQRTQPGHVTVTALKPFTLGDVYSLRCFATASLVLGMVDDARPAGLPSRIANVIVAAGELLELLTDGPFRYRLEFVGKGALRAVIREIATQVFEQSPALLNDPQQAPWAVEIHPAGRGFSVELRPRFSPDPRFAYRRDDVPAASHPPLAAAMARLAGHRTGDIVWDPFCGSGSELIERAILGGVAQLHGSDLSATALAAARKNLEAAALPGIQAVFHHGDFREWENQVDLPHGTTTLIITNPPMGRRVPVPDLRGLILSLIEAAEHVLQPGGRLVLANPFRLQLPPSTLQRVYQETIDLGGFDVQLEKYEKKTVAPTAGKPRSGRR